MEVPRSRRRRVCDRLGWVRRPVPVMSPVNKAELDGLVVLIMTVRGVRYDVVRFVLGMSEHDCVSRRGLSSHGDSMCSVVLVVAVTVHTIMLTRTACVGWLIG